MSRLRLLIPALVLALLPACNEKPAEPTSATKVEPGKAAAAEAGAPPPAETAPAVEPADEVDQDGETGEAAEPPTPLPEEFEQVGVATCDAYVQSYVACIADKVPEADREAQRRVVFENTSSWKQTAAGGGAAEKGLQTACKIATEQAKRATQQWGCEW